MRALVLIPFILAAALYLTNRMGVSGSIVDPGTFNVQERIAYHASQWGLDPALVKAIAKIESNFNPTAKNPADPSYGLMQITPALAYDYGLIRSPRDPSTLEIDMIYDINNNLSVACWFLSRLINKYPFNQAIQSYNVGEWGYKNGVRNFDYLNKVRVAYEKFA